MSGTAAGSALGPLSAVLDQMSKGTSTVAAMARNTGIDVDVLRAALDHLVRTGRVAAHELPIGCPTGGCGSCASATGCGVAPANGARRGLVTLSLTPAR
jgi:hypothetical protein